ncbi:hypothetical protein RND81_12G150200 [Saponaria officinalis]|uniref:Uncharacterized protein n=1 Tax=Saponaria officinalis TaxID=3572 RepID=A0AAW1HAX0_SAPOF
MSSVNCRKESARSSGTRTPFSSYRSTPVIGLHFSPINIFFLQSSIRLSSFSLLTYLVSPLILNPGFFSMLLNLLKLLPTNVFSLSLLSSFSFPLTDVRPCLLCLKTVDINDDARFALTELCLTRL